MATQPPTEPNRIEPQSPPEAPPAPAEPIETHPSETEPLSPDFYQPERSRKSCPTSTYPMHPGVSREPAKCGCRRLPG